MTIVTTVGGDLFRIALTQLGDATQWNRIAAINGLSDPIIRGYARIQIPPVDRAAGGGFGK